MEAHDETRALLLAADIGNLDIVKQLIASKKSDVNGKYNSPNRAFNKWAIPLHYAARSGHLEVVKFLVENGSNINSVDVENWTALHYSCNNGHEDIVKYLLSQKIDTTPKDTIYNQTALGFAKHRQFLKIVKLLDPHDTETWKRSPDAIHKGGDKPIYPTGTNVFLFRYFFKNKSDEAKLLQFRRESLHKTIIIPATDLELKADVTILFDHDFEIHRRHARTFDSVIRRSSLSTNEYITVVRN